MKQEITRSMRYKDNMEVTFATDLMVAKQTLEQTVTLANGTAKARFQSAAANAQMTQQTVQAEIDGFSNISTALGLTPTEVLDYLWWDLLKDDYKDPKEFLVGVNPAAYIRSDSHTDAATQPHAS
eukprot:6187192-Pleurochrysis_carterae.AAC.2